MKTRHAISFGLIACAAVATLSLFLSREDEEPFATDVPWTGGAESDDPFADMIEEGGGLIAQLRAEAAERLRKVAG